MANVFLDANILIDLTRRQKDKIKAGFLEQHNVYISPLSIHILFYSYKMHVPSSQMSNILSDFAIVDMTKNITEKSMQGPTSDLEDNIQLHSASEADCNFFLTRDKTLLSLGYFGKTKISSSL